MFFYWYKIQQVLSRMPSKNASTIAAPSIVELFKYTGQNASICLKLVSIDKIQNKTTDVALFHVNVNISLRNFDAFQSCQGYS